MAPARGDRKPCSVNDCSGIMQFGRRTQSDSGPGVAQAVKRPAAGVDPNGWNCSRDPDHFREPGQAT
jgi:hypothetical protein